MTKPLLIMDQHFRKVEELFRPDVFRALAGLCRIEGAKNWPMDPKRIDDLLTDATFYVSSRPALQAEQLARASSLRAVMEVSGAFHDDLDYEACFDRDIEVLSCIPSFRYAVAEMTLAMILAGARGLVHEHEAFRNGSEGWLEDRDATDFSLYGQTVGYIGYGQIARQTHKLLEPFAPVVGAYDPWLSKDNTDVELFELDELVTRHRVIVVAAAPSKENKHLLSADLISRLAPGTLVVVVSRAYCVDFPALIAAAESGRIRVATDVFPVEPLKATDPLRQSRNIILSPHRAAAVPGGRFPIGDMILHDVSAILNGDPTRQLKAADRDRVASLAGGQRGIQAVR